MTDRLENDLDVQVAVEDGAIIVISASSTVKGPILGSSFPTSATILTHRCRFTFRARAWTPANDEARELRWIV